MKTSEKQRFFKHFSKHYTEDITTVAGPNKLV